MTHRRTDGWRVGAGVSQLVPSSAMSKITIHAVNRELLGLVIHSIIEHEYPREERVSELDRSKAPHIGYHHH